MSNTTTQLTDEELMAKLEESHLEPSHKTQLKKLIPNMLPKERKKVLGFIEQSHKVKTMETEANKDLWELNNEFDKKMDQAEKNLTKAVRKEAENVEKRRSEKDLEALEKEIKNL